MYSKLHYNISSCSYHIHHTLHNQLARQLLNYFVPFHGYYVQLLLIFVIITIQGTTECYRPGDSKLYRGTRKWSGRLQFPICLKETNAQNYQNIHRKEYAIYGSNNTFFKKSFSFDIHSSINSIILHSMFVHWNTTQYFDYTCHIAYYNRDHNCLQRLCQYFLKASSPLHILH